MDRTKGGRTDDASIATIAVELKMCTNTWDPKVRLLGNIRAEDIGRLCIAHIEIIKLLNDEYEHYRKLDMVQHTFENTTKVRTFIDLINKINTICKPLNGSVPSLSYLF